MTRLLQLCAINLLSKYMLGRWNETGGEGLQELNS
jgi:hypothetical protein